MSDIERRAYAALIEGLDKKHLKLEDKNEELWETWSMLHDFLEVAEVLKDYYEFLKNPSNQEDPKIISSEIRYIDENFDFSEDD